MSKNQINKFNAMPAGWRSIPHTEVYTTLFGRYDPELLEYRQITSDTTGAPLEKVIMAHLHHYYDGTGVAIEVTQQGVNFYAFGCDHDNKGIATEEELARTYPPCSTLKCSKCGHFEWHDTSD